MLLASGMHVGFGVIMKDVEMVGKDWNWSPMSRYKEFALCKDLGDLEGSLEGSPKPTAKLARGRTQRELRIEKTTGVGSKAIPGMFQLQSHDMVWVTRTLIGPEA